MKSITSKTLGVLVGLMIIIGIIASFALNMSNSQKLEDNFAVYKQNLTNQIAIILQEPVYVYDAAVSQAIVDSFKGDLNIVGIKVTDQRQKPLAELSKQGEVNESLNIPILWENKSIGYVDIELTHQVMSNELSALNKQAMLTVAAFIILMTVAVSLILQKLVLRPLSDVNNVLADIAGGGGDLTARIPVKSEDEIGQLATSFNSFIETVQTIVKDMAGAAAQLESVTASVREVKDNTTTGTHVQSELTQNSVTSMLELDRATQEIASSTETAVQKANQAVNVASESRNSVEGNMGNIHALVQNLEQTADEVSSLKKASDNIGSVLDVIKGIAEQTNLLALNAAIEAARAGESGRGFAVVADEVRALASKTHDSTEEIESIIQELQTQAETSYQSTQESKNMVSETIERATSTGQALEHISEEINAMSDMILTISSACEEQSTVSRLVSNDMGKLEEGSRALSDSSQVLEQQTEQLFDVTSHMVEQLNKFKY